MFIGPLLFGRIAKKQKPKIKLKKCFYVFCKNVAVKKLDKSCIAVGVKAILFVHCKYTILALCWLAAPSPNQSPFKMTLLIFFQFVMVNLGLVNFSKTQTLDLFL